MRGKALTVPVTLTALTFREEQCAAYNHRPDLFKSFPGPMDWVPRYAGVAARDQCKLTCQARALGYYYVLEPRVSRAPGRLCPHSHVPLPSEGAVPLRCPTARPAASSLGPVCSWYLENKPQLWTGAIGSVACPLPWLLPSPCPLLWVERPVCGLWGKALTLSHGLLRQVPVVLRQLLGGQASGRQWCPALLCDRAAGWRPRAEGSDPQSASALRRENSYRLAAL